MFDESSKIQFTQILLLKFAAASAVSLLKIGGNRKRHLEGDTTENIEARAAKERWIQVLSPSLSNK
jgi:hypothetical protein